MIGLGDAIHQTFANRDWTREERDSIEDVLDAAAAFADFRLPLGEALKVGVLPNDDGRRSSAAFGRVRAILAAHPSDPRRAALMQLFDVVIGAQAGVQTDHGFFMHEDLIGTGVTVHGPRRAA